MCTEESEPASASEHTGPRAVLSPGASATQPQLRGAVPLTAVAGTTLVMVYLLYFPLLLRKLSLWWSVPLGLTHSAREVTQGAQELTSVPISLAP